MTSVSASTAASLHGGTLLSLAVNSFTHPAMGSGSNAPTYTKRLDTEYRQMAHLNSSRQLMTTAMWEFGGTWYVRCDCEVRAEFSSLAEAVAFTSAHR
jgi:hypothetical protein